MPLIKQGICHDAENNGSKKHVDLIVIICGGDQEIRKRTGLADKLLGICSNIEQNKILQAAGRSGLSGRLEDVNQR
jgi:hypothetical protein